MFMLLRASISRPDWERTRISMLKNWCQVCPFGWRDSGCRFPQRPGMKQKPSTVPVPKK